MTYTCGRFARPVGKPTDLVELEPTKCLRNFIAVHLANIIKSFFSFIKYFMVSKIPTTTNDKNLFESKPFLKS